MRRRESDAVNRQAKPRCIRRSGVTLLEALLVILVLSGAAIASSFVMDGNWITNRTVNDLTIDVAQTLDEARNTAIANKSNVRVQRLRQNGIEQLRIVAEAGPYRGESRRIVVLGSEVRLRVRPSEIVFAADGTAARAADWTVSQNRTSGQIIVSPTTGQVSTRLP